MSPISDNPRNVNSQPSGRPPGNNNGKVKKKMSDINVDAFDISQELFDQVIALDTGSINAEEVDVEQHIPFDSNRYADGANASLYMRPPSSPPKNRTHDRKHQKKKGSRSRQNKPNKLNLLSPLPDF